MSFVQKFFKLNNGNKIPAISIIGTGTRWVKEVESAATFSDALVNQLKYALTLPGIIHIDAAEYYKTYPEVAKAISQTKKPRNEIFITDKYSTTPKFTENPIAGIDNSLHKLGTNYIDLYLLHSPFITPEEHGFTLEEAWKQMEEIYKAGKAKNIGVSNFATGDLERILKVAEVKPQVNQIEFNAFLQNQTPGIVKYCQDNDIQLEAYCPLGPLHMKPYDWKTQPFYKYLDKLATKYDKTDNEILLRWVTERGIIPVTTSSREYRIKNAHDIFSFSLTEEEVNEITKLGEEHQSQRMYWITQYGKYDQ